VYIVVLLTVLLILLPEGESAQALQPLAAPYPSMPVSVGQEQ